jgi:hypothetical protein
MAAKSAIIHMNAYSISKMVQAIFIDSAKNVPVPVCTSVKKIYSTDQKHSRLNRSHKIYTKQHVHPHLATYLQNIFEFEKHVFIHQLVIISVAQHRENYDIIRQRERFLKSNLMRKPFFAQRRYFFTFKEPRNRFQGVDSASLCSLAGRYDNLIPTRFLAPIDYSKIPRLVTTGYWKCAIVHSHTVLSTGAVLISVEPTVL